MAAATFVCWKASCASESWTIYRVLPDGTADAVMCCRRYLDAARMLRAFRNGI